MSGFARFATTSFPLRARWPGSSRGPTIAPAPSAQVPVPLRARRDIRAPGMLVRTGARGVYA
eukprot:8665126-Lingulodinium_polyedra.AAC.1